MSVGLRTVGPGAAVFDGPLSEQLGELGGGEVRAVEFLTVVKSCGGVHAGVRAGGVSVCLAAFLLSRSSRLLVLRALEIDRLAARMASGI